MFKYIITTILFITASSTVCANNTQYNIFSITNDTEYKSEIHDPFEKINRKIYKFNQTIDKYSLKPITNAYIKTIPAPARNSISNALNNITLPITIANSILQLDFKNTVNATAKFTINSTIGLLGLFDIAKKIGISAHKEDLGQTLAKYKVPSGPFLMVPFLGAFTLRSITGKTIDTAYSPLWLSLEEKTQIEHIRYSISILRIINSRANLYNTIEDIEKNTLDPYSVIKSAYIQNRINLINND